MAGILRGDIVWADLNPTRGNEQAGMRPVVVLSEDHFNRNSRTVIAVAVTSKPPRAKFPFTLELSSKSLPRKSWVKIVQVRTLSVDRLGKKIGEASASELDRILEGLNEILGA